MRLVSNLVRARYRNQVLFRPTSNGNSAGVGRIRINSETTRSVPIAQVQPEARTTGETVQGRTL